MRADPLAYIAPLSWAAAEIGTWSHLLWDQARLGLAEVEDRHPGVGLWMIRGER